MSGESLNFSQQKYFISPRDVRPVHLIGAGSVGSHIASMLARIGVTDLTAWDHDSIDSHNIGPSLYGMQDFGKYKVDALSEILLRDTGVAIKRERRMYDGERLKGTIICAVDSMEARQMLWKRARKENGRCTPRLALTGNRPQGARPERLVGFFCRRAHGA